MHEDGFSWLLMLRQYSSTFIAVREVFANTVRRIQDEWCYENPVGESQLIAHVKQPCSRCEGQELQILDAAFQEEGHVTIRLPVRCSCEACEAEHIAFWRKIGMIGTVFCNILFGNPSSRMMRLVVVISSLAATNWIRPWWFIPSSRNQLHEAAALTVSNCLFWLVS